MIRKAWPMVFGQVADYPALEVNLAVEGVTLDPVGFVTWTGEVVPPTPTGRTSTPPRCLASGSKASK